MDKQPPVPYLESYWVVPGKLIAGEYPGAHHEENSRRNVQGLIKSGVTMVIDLTMPTDTRKSYAGLLNEEAEDYGVVARYSNYPIPDFTAPSDALMKTILNEIDAHIATGGIVYVHCLAGIGRTGTVVGCYLVRHGLSGEAAIEHIKTLRAGTASWWQRSPEAQDQVDMILDWNTGD